MCETFFKILVSNFKSQVLTVKALVLDIELVIPFIYFIPFIPSDCFTAFAMTFRVLVIARYEAIR